MVAVRAAAGVGKTTLLEAALRVAAESGFTTLRSSGTELERELAFGVVRQLFERPVRALVGEREPALLSGAAALAVPVVLEPAAEQGSADIAHAAMHGLYWLAAEMAARGPLLLVVDDAHWADRPSLRWLAYLGRRLEGVPLLVFVAYRPGEPGAESRPRRAGARGGVGVRPRAEIVQRAGGREMGRRGVRHDAGARVRPRVRDHHGRQPVSPARAGRLAAR